MPLVTFAQSGQFKLGWWNQKALNGSFMLEGLYRSQETILNSGKTEKPQTLLFNGELNLHSKGYLWHPNFMQLDIDLNYSPGTRRDKYLVIPDRSETYTAEQLKISSTFFKQRPLSFNVTTNWNHNFINRELASNVESFNSDYSVGLSFTNSVAPISINYNLAQWEQKELQTGRVFRNNKKTLRSEINKSFSTYDYQRLMLSYNDYQRQYLNAYTVNNYVSSYRLINNFYLDEKKQSSFNSLVWYYDQNGHDVFQRLQVNERLKVKLPQNFRTSAYYGYTNYEQAKVNSRQHQLRGKIEHQLYLSLNSYAFLEYSDFDQTTFNEIISKKGLGFDYTKKIADGSLRLKYEYSKRSDKQDSDPRQLYIANEEHPLADNSIVLLSNPYVVVESIVITNYDGSIIFQENIDYLLIQHEAYIEVQRLPGGQIADGETVLVDYSTNESVSFEFDAINQNLFFSISFWDNLFETYFRYFDQSCENIKFNRNLVIKNIVQRTSGLRLSYSIVDAGFEYEDYKSNIIPYFSRRYYLKFNHRFSKTLRAHISGNMRNYHIKNERGSQDFKDISTQIIYLLSPISQLKFEGGYRFQKGRGLDLTLYNFRSEFSTRFRQVILKTGIENYDRDFSGEKVSYWGGYVRLERYF
jgi:hypothetical protein